ncbi:MAG TPA: hypothetical protein VMH49_04700 [Thermoplasmata archaeon]|nr:hypothetical protein [Thermoplasmata archaeon]
MTEDGEPAEKPEWHTGALWGILAVLLVLGAAGSATVVYGVLGWWAGSLVDAAVAAVGAATAVLALLFTLGILYRVDRYRGVPHRRVELFE